MASAEWLNFSFFFLSWLFLRLGFFFFFFQNEKNNTHSSAAHTYWLKLTDWWCHLQLCCNCSIHARERERKPLRQWKPHRQCASGIPGRRLNVSTAWRVSNPVVLSCREPRIPFPNCRSLGTGAAAAIVSFLLSLFFRFRFRFPPPKLYSTCC